MYIKAKYPKIGNDYVGYQGYGTLNGGNQVSIVSQEADTRSLVTINESLFPDNPSAFNKSFNTAFR